MVNVAVWLLAVLGVSVTAQHCPLQVGPVLCQVRISLARATLYSYISYHVNCTTYGTQIIVPFFVKV